MQTGYNVHHTNTIKKTVLSTIISYILLLILYGIILNQDMSADKERYTYAALNQAEHIRTTIDCVMSRTNTLKTLIKESNGDTDWFDHVAEDIYTSIQEEPGVSPKNFAIAPGGVVSDVYPIEGNEQLIGFDFLDISREGNLEAKEAYEKGGTILTNPFELVQGGIGMGGRAAVLLKNGDRSTLWGLVTVTIDFENLIKVLGLDDLKGMGADYSLSYIDADGNAQFMHGDTGIGNDTVKARFNVRNLVWELELKPVKGWFSAWKFILSICVILVISCFVGLLTHMIIRLRESNALLHKLSTTDVLTGCYNRRAYEEKIMELSSAELTDDLVYVAADVNGLKQVNDTLGHSSGDELLFGAAKCMEKVFGQYGSLYRTGGDEFVAIITADKEMLSGIKEKLNTEAACWSGETVDKLSFSVGYASHSEFPDMTIEELSKTADEIMYEEKQEYYRKHDRRRRV